MKHPTLFLFCLLCLHPAARAQRSYAEAIQMGDAAFRRGEYKTAVDKYFAAEAFDPSKKETVKEKVNAVFDIIERLRGEADRAKKEAQDALAEVREKNRAAFESFANLGARLIYTLDHEEALEKINGEMKLSGLSPFVSEVFKITNLAKRYDICQSREEALAAFSQAT